MPARVVIQDPELSWKGEWNADTTYPAESVVGYNGESWVTSELTQGTVPTGGAPWSLVASKGEQGPEGPQGPAGSHTGQRFYGEGPPGTVIGASPGDEYVDTLTGDLYVLS